jgi:hypothetical protein
MTTGRINQVTTFQFTQYSAAQSSATFFRQEFISLIQSFPQISWSVQQPRRSMKTTLFPVLTLFRCNISCHSLQQKSCPSQRTACNQRKTLDHGGFSTFLIATRLAISKQPTFFLQSHLRAYSSCSTSNRQPIGSQSPFRFSIHCYFTALLIRYKTSQPIPFQNAKAYSNQK